MLTQERIMQRRGAGYFLWAILISVLLIVTCQPSGAHGRRLYAQKKYKVELTFQEWYEVVQCLKQTNSPAAIANKYIDAIGLQVDPLYQLDQKKLQDSLNKAKPPKQN